jgi:hypothetical protein
LVTDYARTAELFGQWMASKSWLEINRLHLADIRGLANRAYGLVDKPDRPEASLDRFLCIVGPSRCGKDVAAAQIARSTAAWRQTRSLSQCFAHYVNAICRCDWYEDRHQISTFLKQFTNCLRDRDPWSMLRFAVQGQNIITGFRDPRELEALRAAHPCLTIWIETGDRVPTDPTLEIRASDADLVLLNHLSEPVFRRRIDHLTKFL